MWSLLIIIIAVGIILEVISLKRDPAKVKFNYVISTGTAEPGTPIKVQSIITNQSRIPISYLLIRELFPHMAELPDGLTSYAAKDGVFTENVCRVKGRQRKKIILETSINKRGVHMFMGDSIEFGDFLGFRELIMAVTNKQEVVVYPERMENRDITDALANFCGDIAAKRYLIRDPILTVGCREYTGREPMKDINWLQSARRGDLMVREYEYNRQLSVNVALSVEGIDYLDDDTLDKCCSAARTICESLVDRGIPVSFFTNALLRRTGKKEIWRCEVSLGHTGGLLEGLGRASSQSCGSLDDLLEFAHRANDSEAAFIVILPANAENAEEEIAKLKSVTRQEVLAVSIES